MAPAAPTATIPSPSPRRDGQRARTSTPTPAATAVAVRMTIGRPTDVPSAVPRSTPTSFSSAAMTASAPRVAADQATAKRRVDGRRAVGTMMPPSRASPRSNTRPTYSAKRPPMASSDGPADDVTAAPVTAPPDVAGPPDPTATGDGAALVPAPVTPTPNANEPAAACPSTAETVRQVTVYHPGDSGPSGTLSCSGWPATTTVGPAVTGAPLVSRTLIDESFGSGGSPNVIVTWDGPPASVAPAAGSEDWSSACASAVGAVATTARSAAASARPAAAPSLRGSGARDLGS